jgi:hypothetical protein
MTDNVLLTIEVFVLLNSLNFSSGIVHNPTVHLPVAIGVLFLTYNVVFPIVKKARDGLLC